MNANDYVSISNAALTLGIKAPTIRSWARSGKIKSIRLVAGGNILIPKSEITRIQNENFTEGGE